MCYANFFSSSARPFMDDFDLYLSANLSMYSYCSTKNSLCMVKDRPKGGGRSYIILYIYIIYCAVISDRFWNHSDLQRNVVRRTNFFRSTTKHSGKKALQAWIRFNAGCFTAYLTVRRTSMANTIEYGCFPRSYIWKLNLSISWFNGEER